VSQGGLREDWILMIEDVAGSAPTTVWNEVVAFTVEGNISLFADTAHDRSATTGRECWRHKLVLSIES
jgi:hypothetical protein